MVIQVLKVVKPLWNMQLIVVYHFIKGFLFVIASTLNQLNKFLLRTIKIFLNVVVLNVIKVNMLSHFIQVNVLVVVVSIDMLVLDWFRDEVLISVMNVYKIYNFWAIKPKIVIIDHVRVVLVQWEWLISNLMIKMVSWEMNVLIIIDLHLIGKTKLLWVLDLRGICIKHYIIIWLSW